jgi:methylated-DNA-protein-cysteine methyltransferase-like protein
MIESSYERIYEIVRQVPAGRVATYGQIAALAGLGGHARLVGYALSALHDDESVPWHRVINARGEVSDRSDRYFEAIQRELLEREGVVADDDGRVALSRYRWSPSSAHDRTETAAGTETAVGIGGSRDGHGE